MFVLIKRGALLIGIVIAVIGFWQLSSWWYWLAELEQLRLPPIIEQALDKPLTPTYMAHANAMSIVSPVPLPAPQLHRVSQNLPTAQVSESKAKSSSIDSKSLGGKAKGLEVKGPDSIVPGANNKNNDSAAIKPALKRQNVSHADIDNVYQQLHSNQSLNIQLVWPREEKQREQIIEHLYQCTAMQFAVLKDSQLIYVSPTRYVKTSQWLRVAQGALSQREKKWLQGQNGTPVRLFAQSIDWKLSRMIARNLKNTTLRSLRADYMLTTSGLMLTNINLNGLHINENWLLDGTPKNC